MTVVVYLIGALLVIAGAVFVDQGVPIVRLEIGWTEIIGGAVAASAGFVILAIGVVLTKLQSMERTLRGLGMANVLRGVVDEPEPEPEVAPLATPAAQAERPFAPHPLAPAVALAPPPRRRAPVFAPVVGAREAEPELHVEPPAVVHAEPYVEPHVEPEPPLAEAPLHHEPLPTPDLEEHRHDFDLNDGAPALAATIDHAPPVPPVEPLVPAVVIDEPETPDFLKEPAPEPSRGRPNFLASFLARRSAAVQRATSRPEEPPAEPRFTIPHEPEAPTAPRTSVDLSSGWDEPAAPEHPSHDFVHPLRGSHHPSEEVDGQADQHTEPAADGTIEPHEHDAGENQPHATAVAELEPEEEPSHAATEAAVHDPSVPVVVGRYNAGSASYIMYSNGMIEVETDSGTHQFASMQELKAFIERRDAAGG